MSNIIPSGDDLSNRRIVIEQQDARENIGEQETSISLSREMLDKWRKAETLLADVEKEDAEVAKKLEAANEKVEICQLELGYLPEGFSKWFNSAYLLGFVTEATVKERSGFFGLRVTKYIEVINNGKPFDWLNAKKRLPMKFLLEKETHRYFYRTFGVKQAKTDLEERDRIFAQIQTEIEKKKSNIKVRSRICNSLTKITGDAFDSAKLLVPIVLSLMLAGTLAIPAAPALIAGTSLVLARLLIAGLCNEKLVY